MDNFNNEFISDLCYIQRKTSVIFILLTLPLFWVGRTMRPKVNESKFQTYMWPMFSVPVMILF